MELGSGEILVILIVALLIYGGRLPEVARSIGKSFGELKRGLSETKDVVARELDADLKVDLDVDLDAQDKPAREVRRVQKAPDDLAREDITKPQDASDPTRHEHPN